MNLKTNLNPFLSVAAAVVAYASGADAQNIYYADYNTKTCKSSPAQAWGAHFATIQDCCTTDLSYVAENVCVAESNGQVPTGTNKWYIDWSLQNCVQDCVDPTNPNCKGLAAAWVTLFDSQGECCEDSFTDGYRGDCLVPSASPSAAPSSKPSAAPSESPSSKPSESPSDKPSAAPSASPSDMPTLIGEFIVDQPNNKCLAKPAGDTWSATYTTIKQCCMQGLPWVRKQVCVSNSGGPAFSGTNKWYMDWVAQKCVQDCVSGTDCGGFAETYETLFATETACCDNSFTGTWRGNCPP